MFGWPSSLVYFISPAIVLAAAVSILARREPRRPPTGTMGMLGMPVVWACVASLIGHVPVLAWALLGPADAFGSIALLIIVLAAVLMAIVVALPMGVASLAAARLGDAAISRMMWAMALAAGVSMIVGYIISEALFAHGMLRDNGIDLIALAALCSVIGASVGALVAAPTAHRARPFTDPPLGICPDCGYDASGLLRCPECGVKMPES
ncbi:MAG: hypothetical protein NCW75_09505 [Phycisphaera sp.]|nr:MAG: hypothetical protein NCW75_09505 [Phycisphaera sp.]